VSAHARHIVPTNRDIPRAFHDPQHRPLTFSVLKAPHVGTLVFRRNGAFVFTVPKGFHGLTRMVVRAYNGVLYSAPLTVFFEVAAPHK
jgi:hypothetical protein